MTSESQTEQNPEDEIDVEARRLEILEQEPLVRLFSSPANSKMLVALIDAAQDMTASEIARQAGVSRNAWYDNKDLLLELGLVEETRQEAGATFYQANLESNQMDALTDLYDALRIQDSEN